MAGRIDVKTDGAIGWIVFDHPERRNAISVEMWRQLPAAASELANDPAVRVVVLRGSGETAFVAGADISEFQSERTADSSQGYDSTSGAALIALTALDKPVLAMIHGFCIGGGVTVALTADLRYAADDATFAIPAARLGLGYHWSGVERLVQLVGPSLAKELFFTARRFDATEAAFMGLVNAVFPKEELEERVRETAEQIATNAPLTVRSVKLIAEELGKPPDRRNVRAMDESIRACFESEDYREGVRAFLEKRQPDFRGR